MLGTYKGNMVVSLAGHDRGIACIVLHEEGDFLWVADGRTRKVESPKKKRRKHVRLITGEDGKPKRFDGTMLTNRFVRTWLRENAGCVQL